MKNVSNGKTELNSLLSGVAGEYELDLPKSSKKVAVKIIDMLGEEILIVN